MSTTARIRLLYALQDEWVDSGAKRMNGSDDESEYDMEKCPSSGVVY